MYSKIVQTDIVRIPIAVQFFPEFVTVVESLARHQVFQTSPYLFKGNSSLVTSAWRKEALLW